VEVAGGYGHKASESGEKGGCGSAESGLLLEVAALLFTKETSGSKKSPREKAKYLTYNK
jgi:hypothetical protein